MKPTLLRGKSSKWCSPVQAIASPYIGERYRAATLKKIDFTGYNIPEPSEAIFYSRGFRQNPIADLRSEANVNKYEISGWLPKKILERWRHPLRWPTLKVKVAARWCSPIQAFASPYIGERYRAATFTSKFDHRKGWRHRSNIFFWFIQISHIYKYLLPTSNLRSDFV